jgi:hypothetical protein
MYIKFRLVGVILLMALYTHAQNTTYYVSSSEGSDTFDGLSDSTAWASVHKVRISNFQPGDTVRFKRDDVWPGVFEYFPKSNLYFTCYGLGDLPVISNVRDFSEMKMTSQWENVNGFWQFDSLSSPVRLFIDSIEILRSSTLSSLGEPDSTMAIGKWYFNDSILYLVNDINPALDSEIFEGSQGFYTLLMEGSTGNTFDSIAFEGGGGSSLQFSGGTNNVVQYCELGKNGNSGILLTLESDSNHIHHNTFDSNFTFYYGLGSERGCGDGVRLTTSASYNIIEYNTFKNWAHNAIEMFQNSIISFGTNFNKVRYNTISAPDIPYAHPIGLDGGLGRCTGNEISYNEADSCRTACQINGNNNWFHHNKLKNFHVSPCKISWSAHAIVVSVYDPLNVGNISKENIFEHNLIETADEAAIRVHDSGYPELVDGHIFRNNIFINTGLAPIGDKYAKGTSIWLNNDSISQNMIFENNLFYQDSAGFVLYEAVDNKYISIDSFNNYSGPTSNQAFNNIKADPLLDSLDYPMTSSPCINMGTIAPQTVQHDFVNAPRIVGGKIDIGPLENQDTCSLSMVIFIDSSAIGANTGYTWIDAKLTIPEAFSVCNNIDCREFWVAKGTYFPTPTIDSTIYFSVPDSTSIYGGFEGVEIIQSDRNIDLYPSILSGNIGDKTSHLDNSNYIIYQENSSKITFDGLQIFDSFSTGNGGAIFCSGSSLNFTNCIIQNHTSQSNAGIHIINSTLNLTFVDFLNLNSETGVDLFIGGISYLNIIQQVLINE